MLVCKLNKSVSSVIGIRNIFFRVTAGCSIALYVVVLVLKQTPIFNICYMIKLHEFLKKRQKEPFPTPLQKLTFFGFHLMAETRRFFSISLYGRNSPLFCGFVNMTEAHHVINVAIILMPVMFLTRNSH